ncbi:MAG: NADH oxidoreductase (quinone) subunit F [Deltaproteobacteria bacterium]|nr:MAG: NADH oxidoreductase (quinone) subunit F [Deltaproteobacteria bacterium]
MEKILTRNWNVEGGHTLAHYRSSGGYEAFRKALGLTPEAIIDEVKLSNLRGRGGAGFPTGVKWGFLPRESDVPKYLVINADEGEPGTFKDRYIMERDPHRLLEGCLISAWALGLKATYIYIRGEMVFGAEQLEAAIEELHEAGLLGEDIQGSGLSHDIHVHRGAGAYICGEETALIESLEGKAGQPRLKPPFPAVVGVFGCPTIVNNVETIACVPTIIERGGEWFAEQGSERNGGPKLAQLSGRVKNPGTYEVPSGLNLREFIFDEAWGGGILGDGALKGVIPGGSSCPVLTPDEIDVGMDFDQLMKAGSMGGTSGVIVISEDVCIVRLAARTAHFYHHESCGQCTPCREGTGWVARILDEIEAGRGRMEDLDLLLEICDNVEGNTICPLGDAMAMPVRAFLMKYRDEFEQHIREGACPFPEW